MTSDCTKTTAGFRITVALVAGLVLYPLSFGPACWISERSSSTGLNGIRAFYYPILWAASHNRGALGRFVAWYAEKGMRFHEAWIHDNTISFKVPAL